MASARADVGPKLRGEARYGPDADEAGMLWGALVLSPVAHGRLRRIDLAPARARPGVVTVIGPGEVPGLLPRGRGDAERPIFPSDEIVYRGQPLAAVAARTRDEARAAAAAVTLEIDPLPVREDLDALFPDWPDARARRSEHIGAHVRAAHGPLRRAFEAADFVQRDTYRTSGVLQVALEPHAALGDVRDGDWRVLTTTQTPFGIREDAAALLGLPEKKLVVEGSWVGGGFGGKNAAFLEPFALLLSAAAHRPVRLALDYREEFLLSRSTLPAVIRLESAVREGRLTARRARLLLDSGTTLPGRDFTVGYAIGFLLGPYRIPAFEVEGFAIRTHKPPFGPHRAPFAPQCVFAVESHTDAIARRLRVDPIDFRLAHAWKEGDTTALGQRVGPFGLVPALERARAVAEEWRARRAPGHGVGLACGFWSTFTAAGGEALLRLSPRELVIVQGERDIGNGSVLGGLPAVAERVLGIPVDAVRVEYEHTGRAPFDSGVFGSRTLAALGQAVEKAAERLEKLLRERMRADGPVRLERRDGGLCARAGERVRSIPELWSSEESSRGFLEVRGRHYGRVAKIDEDRVKVGSFYPYGDFTGAVHLAEVSVDRDTGAVRPVRYAAWHDVGVAVHPALAKASVEGGIAMGLGTALTEETLWSKEGRLLNPGLLDYRIPTMGEIPPIQVEFVEGFAGSGPFGAKGLGEPPIIPVAGAVANAVTDAIGRPVPELPQSAERVARALKLF